MRRYLLFSGDNYYPSGGWRDYKGAFTTINDAFEFLASVSTKDWWQIVDTFDQTIVRESQRD